MVINTYTTISSLLEGVGVLGIQHVASCLQQQCERTVGCNLSLSYSKKLCYQSIFPQGTIGNPCGGNSTMIKLVCLDAEGPFKYGIYQWALSVISSNSLAVKILYPIFWGLMTLSTFGNDLEPTSNWLEVIFSICIVLAGLLFFTLLIVTRSNDIFRMALIANAWLNNDKVRKAIHTVEKSVASSWDLCTNKIFFDHNFQRILSSYIQIAEFEKIPEEKRQKLSDGDFGESAVCKELFLIGV
ncbi:hypothetical protein P8452_38260 [Trifolium repens]|nr:hypothetical protein P8452_38260 [Trifolium repens]